MLFDLSKEKEDRKSYVQKKYIIEEQSNTYRELYIWPRKQKEIN